MKNKISFLLYAIAVTLWPVIIRLVVITLYPDTTFIAVFFILFNWAICLFMLPLVWLGWQYNRPRYMITVGVLFCLPVVYYQGFVMLKLLNLAFGIPGIVLGLTHRAHSETPFVPYPPTKLGQSYVILTLTLPLLHALINFLFPSRYFQDFVSAYQFAATIQALVIVLALAGYFFREPIFTFFSVIMLWMVSQTFSDWSWLVQASTVIVAVIGAISLFVNKRSAKPVVDSHKQEDRE